MFDLLQEINDRPEPFQFYTARELWTDNHTSEQMLAYHLNQEVDLSSRNHGFIDASVDWIVSHFQVGPQSKIADFGCGPGLYTSRLARTQAQVTGIDFSTRSIAHAREAARLEGQIINYVNQDYLEFDTFERFDLILLIMCDYCVLSPGQRQKLLGKFHTLLKPGGQVLLDVNSLTAFEEREEAATYEENQLDGFWSPHKYFGFVNTFKYPREKLLLDKYTIIEADRIRTIYNWMQCFSPESLTGELEANGFEREKLWGGVAGSPFDSQAQEFAVVAKKV